MNRFATVLNPTTLCSGSQTDVILLQDHMDQQTYTTHSLQRDVTVGRNWLLQMGKAARHNSITIQYCMAYPRHVLQSLEIDAVTQVRLQNKI